MTCVAVSAAANGKLNPSFARHRYKTGDIARIRHSNDRGGVTVNAAVENGAREVEQEAGTGESGLAPLPVPTHTVIRIGA